MNPTAVRLYSLLPVSRRDFDAVLEAVVLRDSIRVVAQCLAEARTCDQPRSITSLFDGRRATSC